jgi:hypothetical protein
MNLIRTVLILLVIYFLFKVIARVILPLLVKNFVEKKSREFQDRFNQHHKKPEGEITIETKDSKKNKKHKDDDPGEYVDYEEIKD